MSRPKSPKPAGVTIHLSVQALEDEKVNQLACWLIARLAQLKQLTTPRTP